MHRATQKPGKQRAEDMTQTSDDLIALPARLAAKLAANVSLGRLQTWYRKGQVLQPASVGRDDRPLYRFEDLVELLVANEILGRGVHPRHLFAFLETLDNVDRPLSTLKWAVGKGEVFAADQNNAWVGSRRPNQTVAIEIIEPEEIRATLRTQLTERQATPGDIERRHGTLGNKLVFAGTRTPVAAVQAYLKRGYEPDRILKSFPHLSEEDISVAAELLQTA